MAVRSVGKAQARTAKSHPPRRPRCDRCALPLRTCVCTLAAPVANDVEVVLLQHPDEVDQAKNSVRLLRLSLARLRVAVGREFGPEALLELLDGDVSGSALLYPAAASASARARDFPVRPARLVVLDGTWRQTRQMLNANPLLQSLPRWSLRPQAPARYAPLRKSADAMQLSTLEATCAALAEIEGSAVRYAPLQASFDRFVADRVARAGRSASP